MRIIPFEVMIEKGYWLGEYAVQWRDEDGALWYYGKWVDDMPLLTTLPKHAARLLLKEAQDISSRLAKAGFHMPFISIWADEETQAPGTFPGLGHLITTGHADDLEGKLCPPLESDIVERCQCGRALVFGKCSNINCNWGKV